VVVFLGPWFLECVDGVVFPLVVVPGDAWTWWSFFGLWFLGRVDEVVFPCVVISGDT